MRSKAAKLRNPKRIGRSFRLHAYTVELLNLLTERTGKNATWLIEEALFAMFQAGGMFADAASAKAARREFSRLIDSKYLAKGFSADFLAEISGEPGKKIKHRYRVDQLPAHLKDLEPHLKSLAEALKEFSRSRKPKGKK